MSATLIHAKRPWLIASSTRKSAEQKPLTLKIWVDMFRKRGFLNRWLPSAIDEHFLTRRSYPMLVVGASASGRTCTLLDMTIKNFKHKKIAKPLI